MNEEIIRVVEEKEANGVTFSIVETRYEFGRHFVLLMNGVPDFHSVDLERVQNYMNIWAKQY